MKNGHYEVTFATLFGEGHATIRLEDGLLTGTTDRGTRLDGLCGPDPSRRVIRFEIAATVPPNVKSVTGFTTADAARRIVVRGEVPPVDPTSRFSIDFAGRAVDVVARYIGPL